MTSKAKSSVFLERRAYHKRRMRDFARALPIFGVVLWGIPLFWQQGEQGAANSNALVYLFVVWIFLILLAAGISRAVKSDETPPVAPDSQ